MASTLLFSGFFVGAAVFLPLFILSLWLQRRTLKRHFEQRIYRQVEQLRQSEEARNEMSSEKAKAEYLLRSVLPQEVAEEYINKTTVTPRMHRRATVLFTDFINFTGIAENLRPRKLIEQLDNYFSRFDEVIAKYNIEKIKTVGDAYLCCGGVPISNNSNPIDVLLAALEIQALMEDIQQEKEANGEPFWPMRIGIHTGEIITGVVGKNKLAYDIWGDTVNIAQRVEQASEPGKINISGTTYALVRDFFECEFRGKVKAKHKGMIDMYYVSGIKKKFSKFGKGRVPNHEFFEELSAKHNSFINYKKMEVYILNRLEHGLPETLYYHSVDHARDVHNAVERIAHAERINNEDLLLLKTAALYHDSGFLTTYHNNEPMGAALAVETLENFGFNREQINVIADLILSTKVPQEPRNYLQEIICDADLDYLGRDDFHAISEKLKRELMEHQMVKSDKDWDEKQIRFLREHRYFTQTARNLLSSKKEKHLQEIIARYEANAYGTLLKD